jgi:hypothetical protein
VPTATPLSGLDTLHHTHPTGYLIETTARIWEGVEARLRDMGLSPICHKIYQKPYRVSLIWLHILWVGVSQILLNLIVRVLAPRGNT